MAQACSESVPALPTNLCARAGLCRSDRASRAGDCRSDPRDIAPCAPWRLGMSAFDPQNTNDANGMICTLFKWLPYAIAAAIGSMLYHIGDACRERTWMQRLTTLLVSGCTGAFLGPLAAIVAHDALPEKACELHLAIGFAAAAAGPQGLWMLLRWRSKKSIVELGNPMDIASCKEGMSAEERARHADSCPFDVDRCGGACMSCEHRARHHIPIGHEKQD